MSKEVNKQVEKDLQSTAEARGEAVPTGGKKNFQQDTTIPEAEVLQRMEKIRAAISSGAIKTSVMTDSGLKPSANYLIYDRQARFSVEFRRAAKLRGLKRAEFESEYRDGGGLLKIKLNAKDKKQWLEALLYNDLLLNLIASYDVSIIFLEQEDMF